MRDGYNKHYMVTADDYVCKHYFNNLTTSIFNFHARADAQHHRLGHLPATVNAEGVRWCQCSAQHYEQLLNRTAAFLDDRSHFSMSLNFIKYI